MKAAACAWCEGTLGPALLGSLLLWLALPPWELWPLGWVAPVPWVLLVCRERLPGAHPYRALWLAGLLFWLLAIHWLRLPHSATFLGWIALACYLAFYLPLFVALARVAVHRYRVPVVVAAAVVWTGLELARAHLLTGFLIAALSHTQRRWITLIQISDLAGAYAVSFVVMFVAACLARMWPRGPGCRVAWWPVVPALIVVAAALLYGTLRTANVATRPGPKVALIQGSIAADWKADQGKSQRILRHYDQLSRAAVELAGGDLDLIVWPETMFPHPLVDVDSADPPPPDVTRRLLAHRNATTAEIAGLVRRLQTPMLLGAATSDFRRTGMQSFNSAVLANRSGRLTARYDKMHLVMFGEYIPFGGWFPWMYRFMPFVGLAPGLEPTAIESDGVRYAPSICFETILPQTIRNQVLTLARRRQVPDVLVNLTNDAWFWGSSELDMHLACGVFRAVECRKPLLVAANSGISAWIDADGRVLRQGPRRGTAVILADVRLDPRQSVYLRFGDWPAGLCLLACLWWALAGMQDPYPRRS